ncbi:hypothetical protein BN2497_4377 [Janthinobacterium sp. CG23_2]|nr:hypothetical protein BN2497_4377 [Janthinobacterium sp. CG23_2]CUU28586.1 hypothetical protein BN3177_4377 [Janthinobacterium sp. CG23_2]
MSSHVTTLWRTQTVHHRTSPTFFVGEWQQQRWRANVLHVVGRFADSFYREH